MAPVESTQGPGSGVEEGPLWNARAHDWAEVQEPTGRELYLAVLDALDVGPDHAVLDVGCGSGLFCSLAAAEGARVTGLDASDQLIALAMERAPECHFQVGEMEQMPFPDASFDVVTLLNSLHFAERPSVALREARRVARPNAAIVIGAWDTGEGSAPAAYIRTLMHFSPGRGPLALTEPGVVEHLLSEAGLQAGEWRVVDCPFIYHDRDEALRGLLSPGLATRAINAAGEAPVREAVGETIAPFANVFGAYRMDNRYRFLVTRAPVAPDGKKATP